jgi:protein pelota
MLILKRKENRIKVKPEIAEDLWHLEKVIKPGDLVSGTSDRKFTTESGKSERMPVKIKLQVEKVEFHKPSGALKVLGIIVEGSPEEYVQLKAHHSLEIGQFDIVTIEKEWKKYELDRLKEAERGSRREKVFVLILDERDAEFFVIREFGIETLGKIHCESRGKYTGEGKDVQNQYYKMIVDLISKKEGRIVIAGPAFEKDNLYDYIKDKDQKLSKRIVVESTSNTSGQGVYELLTKGTLDKILLESRFAEETKAVDRFITEVSRKNGKATYGLDNVEKALDMKAVDELLVIDSLLMDKRELIEHLLDKAERGKAKVMIVSHENEISQKLKGFTSIAALLRFNIE